MADKEKKSEQDYLRRLEETFKAGAHLRPAKKPFFTSPEKQPTQNYSPESKYNAPKQEEYIEPKKDNNNGKQQFAGGDILILEDGSLAVYKQKITGKEYDLVYILNPDTGKVSPKGIYVSGYEAEKIGKLPDELFFKLQKTLTWYRDAIIYHLDKFSFCSRIPQITGYQTEIQPTEDSNSKPITKIEEKREKPLQKGRKLTVSFGDREWEAYFWGIDELGYIVVHSTTGNWAAMHLDLKRFGDSIKYGDLLPQSKIQEIDAAIVK